MKYITFFTLIVLLFPVLSPGQPGNKPDSSFNITSIREKIILDTDRHFFASGETLWFSAAYTLNGKLKPKKQLSNILYAELVNSEGNVQEGEKFFIESGIVNGHMAIPEGVPSGYYFLSVYTKFMRNFSKEAFSIVPLVIINPAIPPQYPEQSPIKVVPEFGELIPGIKNKIFITTGSYIAGNSKSVELIEKERNTRFQIKLFDNGLGMTEIIPEINDRYFLKIIMKNETVVEEPVLPDYAAGTCLSLTRSTNGLGIKVLNPDKDSGQRNNYSMEILDAHFRVQSVFSNEGEFMIPYKNLMNDMNFFALKNNGKIIDIRAYFKIPQLRSAELIAVESETSVAGEKTELKIDFPGQNAYIHSVVSISLQGTHWSYYQSIPEIFVNNPELMKTYFRNLRQSSSALEKQAVIITGLYQEKLRDPLFIERIEQQNKPKLTYLPDVRDVSISGKLVSKTTKQAVPGREVYLSVLFDNPQLHIYETKDDGSFVFSMNNLYDEQSICLSTGQKGLSSQNEILIDNDFYDFTYDFQDAPLPEQLKNAGFVTQMVYNAKVSQAFHTSKNSAGEPLNRHTKYFGSDRVVTDLSDYIALESMEEIVSEIIGPLKARRKGSSYELKMMDENSNFLPGQPLILVDNVPVFDMKGLLKIHPSKIEKIELINKIYVYGNQALNGIILITTKTDNFGGIPLPDESVFLEYQTRTQTKPFFMTNEGNRESTGNTGPVFKNTLFWDSFSSADKSNSELIFSRPDHPGNYRISLKCYDKNSSSLFDSESIGFKR